ncbi:hypothetical protein [Burkholderia cenocepacia]|uniref:hypothetical protein n=1 Tax=Burkholderia cenocepacia TaxID=95486 RepID=UPI00265054C1|nr:hypothetical protein [Burkholderia cenocepacia]MDN7678099.1 hypothetical protein [Burkholderia cenocepacia]
MTNKLKTKEEISQWLDKMKIENYSINDDLTVDVDGRVVLSGRALTRIPVKFNNVSDSFYCSDNQLTSLEGAPEMVYGCFYCYNNQLASLEGCPQVVRDFFCDGNKLTSLEGGPQIVEAAFSCANNQLTSLKGAPQAVGRSFSCSNNQLASLEGCPQFVRPLFCDGNKLTSLKFSCENNNISLSEIAHFKALREGSIRIGYCDYTDEEIDKAVKIIKLHEHLNQTIKQKDDLPMARATSNVQVSATRTGKLKI